MKKFLLPGILAVVYLFLPLRSQAAPIDVPYQILLDTTKRYGNTRGVFNLNFPSGVSSINTNVSSFQWCLDSNNCFGGIS